MRFAKYHGLGNDYIVLDPADADEDLGRNTIRLICHRNYGVGADGILLGPIRTAEGGMRVRIFNPDGGEAEKSGNGLRIFARRLWETGKVGPAPFQVLTGGGPVRAQIHADGRSVSVEMGRASFSSERVPVAGPPREVLNEEITVLGKTFRFCAATIGNPHCVIVGGREDVSKAAACTYGPAIETDQRFPARTNVQFLQVLDRGNIRIEIWERGAGYTLASGSSSCAAAAVAHRLGLCNEKVTVHMPGGQLSVTISKDHDITQTGPVVKICEGEICPEMFIT